MIETHQDDTPIASVYAKQQNYNRLLKRANELGYRSVVTFVITKAIKHKESITLIATKLTTSPEGINKIIDAIGIRDKVTNRRKSKQWMRR